jgi:nicotinamide-nucleotide amidase
MNSNVNSFVKKLLGKGLTVAFSESVTCGMAAEKLSACKGASDVLKGAVVCYSPEVKTGLLKIPEQVILKHTCESQKVTDLLAKNLSNVIKADIYAALTGLASAGGTENKDKPVGTIFFSVIYKNKRYSERKRFRGSPSEIREKACFALYKLIGSKI